MQAVPAQRRNHRVRLPVPPRRVVTQPRTARTPAVAPQQVGRDAGFVEKDEVARISERLVILPPPPRPGDVSASLFVGEYRFF